MNGPTAECAETSIPNPLCIELILLACKQVLDNILTPFFQSPGPFVSEDNVLTPFLQSPGPFVSEAKNFIRLSV